MPSLFDLLLQSAKKVKDFTPQVDSPVYKALSALTPVQKEVSQFVDFAQGKGSRAERFKQLPIAQTSPEEMALNFSPMGVTKVAKLLQKPIQETLKRTIDRTQLSGRALDVPSKLLQRLKAGDQSAREELTKHLNSLQSRRLPPPAKVAGKTQFERETSGLQSLIRTNPLYRETPIGRLELTTNQLSKQNLADQTIRPFDDIVRSSNIDVKSKVNFLDYLRTPDRVLKKIGLENEANLIRQKYEDYLQELPEQINKITAWSKRVPKGSNQRIFKWLDGQKITLLDNEQKVANEIKDHLASWADRLKLPKEKRITNYITHIFDRDFLNKEFDPDLAKLIRDKVPGSVYDPFTLQRLGALGYKEDTWQALDAYVKRATRKVHMDQALEQVSKKADSLEQSQFDYVKNYVARVNMRPTDWDNLLDNFIKQTPIGYKFGARPTTAITRGIRQAVYRGTLGLNIGSAVKNLTQGANTFAKLGPSYTLLGYTRTLKHLLTGSDELEKVGVLSSDLIQDRTINATRKFWENLDKGLWFFFDTAEKINRGAAYFGGKAAALKKGASEQQAIEIAKKLVRDTQFTFGSVDTPVLLQSDMAKMLSQFQSYNVKQIEFLSEMIKNKEFGGLIRYLLASMTMVYTVGKAIGMEPKDLIPTVRVANSPFFNLAGDVKDTLLNLPDKYGNEQTAEDRFKTFKKDVVPFIPGGVQIKKTSGALMDFLKGGHYTPKGQLQYPAPTEGFGPLQSLLFGSYATKEAKRYYGEGLRPLSEKQTLQYQQNPQSYEQIIIRRKIDNLKDKIKQIQKNPGLSFSEKKEGISKLQMEMEDLIK